MPEVVVIARDPFARMDIIRCRTDARPGGCAWCGGLNGFGSLFRYGVWHDGGRVSLDDKLFCSKGCHDTYYS